MQTAFPSQHFASVASVLLVNINSSDDLSRLACTLFLRQLNILPNQVHNHVLERLQLDPQHLLDPAGIGFELKTCKGTVVGQQTLLDGLREVLCRVDFGVLPLEHREEYVLVNGLL
jgi:hypothetical protein